MAELIKPTVAYEKAKNSPVYRLSELMFGSLLAAYVLGFVGFVAVNTDSNSPLVDPLKCLPYLAISLTYAYVTAGLYLSYHSGILTMHHIPLHHIRLDFALALSQAIFFGISMIFPPLFSLLLGITLLASAFRQHQEHRALVKGFYREVQPPHSALAGGPETSEKQFQKTFTRLLKEPSSEEKLKESGQRFRYQELLGWGKTSLWTYCFSLFLIALCVVGLRIYHFNIPNKTTAYSCCLIAAPIIFYVHKILRQRAGFLMKREDETTEMDDQFDELVENLKKEYSTTKPLA
ncbi:MAG: hypothetical protein JXA73_11360 [Acidobacteria bacterium]|nr:hypothetical protein [Acidobacteriota bacterium]